MQLSTATAVAEIATLRVADTIFCIHTLRQVSAFTTSKVPDGTHLGGAIAIVCLHGPLLIGVQSILQRGKVRLHGRHSPPLSI